jgi:manganese transport protein
MHGETITLQNLAVKQTSRIAVSLDFSASDEKLIAYAVAQGQTFVTYILLHVVESVSARYLGEASDDDETRKDRLRLENYVMQLQQMGYRAECIIGYRNRVKEIIRIVKESNADMLVMGAHRHAGLKDYIFGETIEDVRHALPIPVLIVSV